jgi:hypothetical protein
MRVVEFVVELTGSNETLLNGRRVDDSQGGIEERVILNKMHLEHQWQVLSELRKLLNRFEHTYQKARVKAGELSMDDYDTLRRASRNVSGARGIPGTDLKRLGT